MTPDRSPLEHEIRRRIADTGPMPVDEFMALCLGDPQHGYYAHRSPLGADGDFVTAPEVSQMFGELIGLWAAATWEAMGAPDPVLLVELGPGRGTMMADAVRAGRALPAFRKAAHIHLVETSPALRECQRQTLGGDVAPRWHNALDEVPTGPCIILANEFFDALPVRQAERRSNGWYERAVAVGDAGDLTWTVMPDPMQTPPPIATTAREGEIVEWRCADYAAAVARRVVAEGAALIVDYGHERSTPGDTFQAVRSHRFTNPLESPGCADLTAHVDFAALGATARSVGARVHGPVAQGMFLKRLGIRTRAAVLSARTAVGQRAVVTAALDRLTGTGPGQMGALFKVMGLSAPRLARLPGFWP